ncbi:glycerol-3-phosphate dehydrogenase [Actinokineospora alba]|uniref:Glycerol-3-phosphate dehydrogenase n=1 Tax=Actinokineospora alba TaxID=504798 RepID=A0A1H0LPB2_9PSEU|nr:glycerol-3-phosphate dehydrogenase/oxidase [Actinokineospora alba]TDP67402.1 glycerol-3-phosphate dehydrogenase [Actinokineospora alba]SDI97596.1 glycerol-3-phosphate dehydrogenase [Actinokineospora alba]SDO70099.1 glycerol-3-phosphate dehydrogenase [Actinokineospora alba]
MSTRLDPAYRAAALRGIEETEFDVLVIGGGVVGAGAALDAAARGLRVALVEARDWAAGTSSRSSKLIHGGLRYLEQRDFSLVREALKERRLLLHRLAPHLVRPVPFLFPLTRGVLERAYVGAGVLLYDTMGGARALPWHKHLSRKQALRLAPSLKPEALSGAIRYYDAQVDDARHTMMITRTAARHGATVLSRAKAIGLLRDGGRVVGARVRDVESGREHEIRARRVISATGVWTDELHAMTGVAAPFQVRMSKGIHLLVPRDRIDLETGLIAPTEKSVLFVIPWGKHWIIGTTDTEWDLDRDHPAASRSDVDYLLEHVNSVLRTPLTAEDVDGVYAGLRPLLAGESSETAKLSREHAVAEPVPGLFVIAGGKYTTYRVMAADVVNAAVRGLGRAVPPSLTERLPVVGAIGYHEMWEDRAAIARRTGLGVSTVEHLLGRYGSAIDDLIELIGRDPSLAEPIPGAEEYLRVEAVYAVTHEGALHLDDILTRRTRISIETPDRGLAAAAEIARLVASDLGWDSQTEREEVRLYHERVCAERAAQDSVDDLTANAARIAAPAC